MKKYILHTLFALLFAAVFTACDKDSDTASTQIEIKGVDVTTTSKTAKISITQPRVIKDGAAQQVRSVGIRYRVAGSSEWINAAATTAGTEHYVINLDGLTPNTQYEYVVWITVDSGTEVAQKNYFTTQDTALEATFGDMQLSIVTGGMRLSVASFKVSVDEQVVEPDRCGADYRAKGASQWISLSNVVFNNDGGFTVDIAAAELTFDTTYEARAWVEVGGNKVYSQRTVERLYEKSELQEIMGEWRLAEWHGSADLQFAVYLSISADGEFTLWQKLQSVEWQKFTGTVEFTNSTVSGVYSDGKAWSTSYTVEHDGNNMIWIGSNDATDRSVYVPTEIPDDLSKMHLSAATRTGERFL